MFEVKKGVLTKIPFKLVSSLDYSTPVTGLASSAVSVYYSKNGGSAVAWSSPTITEVSSQYMPGLYYLTPTSGVVDTAGPLLVGITATGCNPIPIVVDVVEAKQVDTLNQLSAVPYDVWNTSTSGSFSSTSMAKQIELARKVLTNKTVDSGTSITLYDDDGVSVLGTFTWNDVTGVKGKLS